MQVTNSQYGITLTSETSYGKIQHNKHPGRGYFGAQNSASCINGRIVVAPRLRVFFAHPGQPPSLNDTIIRAIDAIRKTKRPERKSLRIYSWTEMSIGGQNLVDRILEEINRSPVFACDLTYPNLNVAFELGYAIARFKRIWIALDATIVNSEERYKRHYYALTGAGYNTYSNSEDLVSSFFADDVDSTLDKTLLGDHYRRRRAKAENPTLLFVKPSINPEPVMTSTRFLEQSYFRYGLIIDDPEELRAPTLQWYASKIFTADAVLLHLLSREQIGYKGHNAKCAIVAGMAHGFGVPLLMTVAAPFETPVDYRDLMKIYNTASECDLAIHNWTEDLRNRVLTPRRPRREPIEVSSTNLELRALSIGEPVAEHERDVLSQYFIQTRSYRRALNDRLTIVVGRKGVGKSAQLYAMDAEFRDDRHRHVCIVKPAGYEIDGLVRVLKSLQHNSERGYLIESLWKFLIYSELAKSVSEDIENMSVYQQPSEDDMEMLDYYQRHARLLAPPFSERLDLAVRSLDDLAVMNDPLEQRQRISEQLHSSQLGSMRRLIGRVLTNQRKAYILIDNLDKPWHPGAEIKWLSQLLWGLLQVGDDIVSEFEKEDSRRSPVNLTLTIFLRSDIFAVIRPSAAEQDKLPIQHMTWSDPGMLRRLVDLRLAHPFARNHKIADIWQKLFPSEIEGKSPWRFIRTTALPRPRDVVFLLGEAIECAINAGRRKIADTDFLEARDRYSEYALRSILAEDDPYRGRLSAVIFAFSGTSATLNRAELDKRLSAAGVPAEDFEFYIDLLCDISFLCIGTVNGFRLSTDESDRELKRRVAMQIARNNGASESYRVSSAFWPALQMAAKSPH